VAEVAGWQQIVGAEAAVAYAYGVAGAQLPQPEQDRAADLYARHDQARDDALLALTAAGGEPVAIPSFFQLPGPVDTPVQARALLALVESRLSVNYADLAAALPAADRQRALDGVLQATDRSLSWGGVAGPWGAQPAD
jgi:hypothetical protein